MRIILEFDGVVFDIAAAWYAAHVEATKAVGWSTLDPATFWRLLRTKGRDSDLLPGARPVKIQEYWARFDALAETPQVLQMVQMEPAMREAVAALARFGTLAVVTLGKSVELRKEVLGQNGLALFFERFERLDGDPRRRPAELRLLASGEPRTVVVAAGDALVRSAGAAEVVVVGISSGPCNAARLHQAGASVVYRHLKELVDSLEGGGHDLIRAGLLPRSLE